MNADKKIDLNCDMGELPDASIEEALMAHITSANVACGGHAGDAASMRRTVEMARRHGVAVGAHPGYPDRANFGRVEMALSAEQIAQTVCQQIGALAAIAGDLAHVKPHGALYNVAAKNPDVARAIGDGAARFGKELMLVGLAGSVMLDVWREIGFRVAAEGFADRRYEPDGSLRSRKFADALITEPDDAAAQALRLASEGQRLCGGIIRTGVAVGERRARANDLCPQRHAWVRGDRGGGCGGVAKIRGAGLQSCGRRPRRPVAGPGGPAHGRKRPEVIESPSGRPESPPQAEGLPHLSSYASACPSPGTARRPHAPSPPRKKNSRPRDAPSRSGRYSAAGPVTVRCVLRRRRRMCRVDRS